MRPATTLMHLDCGTCSMCCWLLGVADLGKPACTWCDKALRPHGGCGIHPTITGKPAGAEGSQPEACADFQCLWLQSQERPDRMPLHLRPNRSNVIMAPLHTGQPPSNDNPLFLHVNPNDPEAWRHPDIQRRIDWILEHDGTAVVVIDEERIILQPGKPPRHLSVHEMRRDGWH